MEDLREEVGTKSCRPYRGLVGKIVKSQMKWAGHMVRMNYERLPKISERPRRICKKFAEKEENHS